MKKQQRFFAQPFRRSYRHQPSPRLDQMRQNKKRKALQALRRQETMRRRGGGAPRQTLLNWSPEQLARVWRNRGT